MNPPARPLRIELNDAVVGGIRNRGPEAVGVVIIGVARVVVAALVLALLLATSAFFDYDVTAVPFAGMTSASALISWLITWGSLRSKEVEGGSPRPTAIEGNRQLDPAD